MVAAFRHDHPPASGDLTAGRPAAVTHVTISRRGRRHDPVDETLAARDLYRHVVASLPTAVTALALVV
jgi:hypothetical protein